MDSPAIKDIAEGVIFTAKIVPGSSKTAICGFLGTAVKIKIAAAPEKGKANEHLIEYLSKQLCVKKNAVSVISGHTNPVKQIQVLGISSKNLLEKLGLKL